MSTRLLAQYYASGAESFTLTVAPAPPRTITPAAAWYYLLGDGSAADYLDEINDAAAVHAELAGFSATITATNLVKFELPAGCVLTWGTAGTGIRDLLGFIGTTMISDTIAPKSPQIRCDLTYLAIKETEEVEVLRSVAVTDTSLYVDSYAEKTRRRVALRFDGQPRATSALSEYKRLRSFFRFSLAPGRVFRYYPDVSVSTSVYNETTAPWGYQTYKHESPSTFAPALTVPDWYQHWQMECLWHSATES